MIKLPLAAHPTNPDLHPPETDYIMVPAASVQSIQPCPYDHGCCWVTSYATLTLAVAAAFRGESQPPGAIRVRASAAEVERMVMALLWLAPQPPPPLPEPPAPPPPPEVKPCNGCGSRAFTTTRVSSKAAGYHLFEVITCTCGVVQSVADITDEVPF